MSDPINRLDWLANHIIRLTNTTATHRQQIDRIDDKLDNVTHLIQELAHNDRIRSADLAILQEMLDEHRQMAADYQKMRQANGIVLWLARKIKSLITFVFGSLLIAAVIVWRYAGG